MLGPEINHEHIVQQWADALAHVGLGASLPLLTIALPVGISLATSADLICDWRAGDVW